MTGRARSTRPSEPPKENTLEIPTLFVHGTLKSGYWNRDPFCGGALEIREVRIRGRLYEGPGFPVLEGPGRGCPRPGDRRPVGRHRHTGLLGGQTGAPIRSGHTPDQSRKHHSGRLGRRVRELLTFDDPDTRIAHHRPPFCPGGSNLYQRVLLHATVKGARELAWVYTAEATGIKRHRIVSGSNRPPPPSPQSAPLLVRVIPITAEF